MRHIYILGIIAGFVICLTIFGNNLYKLNQRMNNFSYNIATYMLQPRIPYKIKGVRHIWSRDGLMYVLLNNNEIHSSFGNGNWNKED